MHEDPYLVLNVSPFATPAQIQRAYRRLAKIYHPDINEQPDADARMQQINCAYELLRDAERRAAFDRAHPPVERPRTRTAARQPYWQRPKASTGWSTRPPDAGHTDRGRAARAQGRARGGEHARARQVARAARMVVLEKRLLGVLSATATLLLTLTLGKAAACTGMPLALAIGCWVGSLRNGRASMVSGLVIGIATALIGPIVLADATAQELGVQRSFMLTLTCMTFGLPFGALVGTALGALAANLRST